MGQAFNHDQLMDLIKDIKQIDREIMANSPFLHYHIKEGTGTTFNSPENLKTFHMVFLRSAFHRY
jgi:hypothetical protein